MTEPSLTVKTTGLTPADGVKTTARRLIDRGGDTIDSDEIYKYIRVIGSALTNLEPHFWGRMAIAKFPEGRGEKDHYYVTNALERIAVTICKRDKAENDDYRKEEFSKRSGLRKHLRKDGVTPWREIPEHFGRQRYLMYLCQEHPQTLRDVGFPQSSIDACSRGANLGQPVDEFGNWKKRDGREVEFHVHHRIPLQCGGSNAIENLSLLDSDIHFTLCHAGDDRFINTLKEGEVCEVALTIPRADVHVIAVGYNAHIIIRPGTTTKEHAA